MTISFLSTLTRRWNISAVSFGVGPTQKGEYVHIRLDVLEILCKFQTFESWETWFSTFSFIFLKKFGRHPLVPLFWTSSDVYLGFQSRGESLAYMLCRPHDRQSHPWCDTCWPLKSQYCSRAFLILLHILAHICTSIGGTRTLSSILLCNTLTIGPLQPGCFVTFHLKRVCLVTPQTYVNTVCYEVWPKHSEAQYLHRWEICSAYSCGVFMTNYCMSTPSFLAMEPISSAVNIELTSVMCEQNLILRFAWCTNASKVLCLVHCECVCLWHCELSSHIPVFFSQVNCPLSDITRYSNTMWSKKNRNLRNRFRKLSLVQRRRKRMRVMPTPTTRMKRQPVLWKWKISQKRKLAGKKG